MTFLMNIIGVILGVAGSAVTFRIPQRALFGTTIAGLLGWLVMQVPAVFGLTPIYGSFLGALCVALCAEGLARGLKMPSTVFVVPGILPLVPGMLTYNSMLEFINGNTTKAVADSSQAMVLASGIAIGMLMGAAFARGLASGHLQEFQEKLSTEIDITLLDNINLTEEPEEEIVPDRPRIVPKKRHRKYHSHRQNTLSALHRAADSSKNNHSRLNRYNF